jgi:hypothetical protein
MREALTGMNALPRQPLPPAFSVQLKPANEKEDAEQPERWARKRAKAAREQIYSRHDDQREGEDHRELFVEEVEAASRDDNDGGRARWDRAEKQGDALAALAGGTTSRDQRAFLIEEIRRQVPDVAYLEQIAAGARTVLTLNFPGSGPLGVKTLNDNLVGYQINNARIAPPRNEAVESAFRGDREPTGGLPFTITAQGYKSTTVTSNLPPHQLRDAIGPLLRAIERDVQQVYLRGLEHGLRYWEAERDDHTTPDTDEHREAGRRVASIKDAITLVHTPDFQFDFQLGMAAIEPGDGVQRPDYVPALAARTRSSQAALMSRDRDRAPAPNTNTDIGDPRGQIYDRDAFLRFCEEGESLRREVIDSGNTLSYHDRQYRVFVGPQANRINRHVLRDVRKGKIDAEDLASTNEVATLRRFQRYFLHVNAFDNIRQFMSKEVERVGEQIQRAQRLIDSLKGDGPVDARAVTETLHMNPGIGKVIPTTETASEAVFYNAERERTNRIIVSCDVRDMGVDLVQHYGTAMYRVGTGREEPDVVAQEAPDRMDHFRREAIWLTRKCYTELVAEAIEAARRRGARELADELSQEIEPSLLMGGDELTLSLHEGMRPYVARLAAALTRPSAPRARVAISTTGSDPRDAVGEHIRAQERADPAHGILKNFEAAQRDLELMVAEIGNFAGELRGAVLVRELKLNLLYAEHTGHDIVLRRSDTNAIVDVAELRGRIAEVKRWLLELKDPHTD